MKHRTLLLAAVLGGIVLLTLWRHVPRPPVNGDEQSTLSSVMSVTTGPVVHASPPAPQDTLSNTETLRRMERLYRLQANLARAQAARDAERVEAILHSAIGKLDTFLERPGLVQRPRFRRVFRTLTDAYETRYGVPDTLRLPDGELYDLRQGLSASLAQTDPPPIVDVLPADLREQNRPVPLTMNEPVRKSMAFLLRHKQEYLYPWLRRASTYFPMIEQIFAEEGVPDEIKYLSLAESGLDPHAQSRAQAAGIWQIGRASCRERVYCEV